MALSPAHLALLDRLTPEQRAHLEARLGGDRESGFALVGRALDACGVRTVAGVPGTPIDRIFSAAAGRGIRCLTTRQQTPAVVLAAAANFLAGRLEAAVVVSAGPAVTQTATGVLVARDNEWPVVVLGGRRAVADEGAGYFQEFDAVPMMAPITKWAATVRQTADLVPMLHRAAETAVSGVPGPVYLDLPEDVLAGGAVPEALPAPVRRPPPAASAADVAAALARIRGAERPLLCLGDGVRWDVDLGALRALVEREGLPFVTTSLARGLLPDSHPLCQNAVRGPAQPRSDLVLMVGAWFDWRFKRGGSLDPGAAVIHVEPDDARRGRNVDPVLAIAAGGGRFLNQLAEASRAAGPPARDLGAWAAELDALPSPAAASPAGADGGPVSAEGLYGVLRDVLPPDAVLVLEGSFHMAHGHHALSAERPLSWLDPGWNGAMGTGLPLALGARLVYPDRPVVAVVGDTGFGMSGMEIETAARHDLPVLVLVVNNGGINGRQRQRAFLPEDHPEGVFTFSDALRYDGVAGALGAASARVSDLGALRSAVAAALESGRLACLDVVVDPYPARPAFW